MQISIPSSSTKFYLNNLLITAPQCCNEHLLKHCSREKKFNYVNRDSEKKYERGIGNKVKLNTFTYCSIYPCIINLQKRARVCNFPVVFVLEWRFKHTTLETADTLHWIKTLGLLNMTWISHGYPRFSTYEVKFIILYSYLYSVFICVPQAWWIISQCYYIDCRSKLKTVLKSHRFLLVSHIWLIAASEYTSTSYLTSMSLIPLSCQSLALFDHHRSQLLLLAPNYQHIQVQSPHYPCPPPHPITCSHTIKPCLQKRERIKNCV